ncbi:MAG: hypothetical protein JSR46_04925 [Verrucomicrobia bacterium]|nr:hypothetical protein [Verrucomicrobiota bacterium]
MNPLNNLLLSSTDFSILKANEVDGVIVLRVAIPEGQQNLHPSIAGRKAVVLKWTKQTTSELAVHRLLTGKPEFITLLYGEEGFFSLHTLFPKMSERSINNLKIQINATHNILNKQNTFTGGATHSFMVMEAMDDSLESKLPYLSKEARASLEQPVSRILRKAIKTLEKENVSHGDLQPRNIFIKEISPNVFRVKCGDFGSAGPLTKSNRDNVGPILDALKTKEQCRATKNSNCTSAVTGAISVTEGLSPKKAVAPTRTMLRRQCRLF